MVDTDGDRGGSITGLSRQTWQTGRLRTDDFTLNDSWGLFVSHRSTLTASPTPFRVPLRKMLESALIYGPGRHWFPNHHFHLRLSTSKDGEGKKSFLRKRDLECWVKAILCWSYMFLPITLSHIFTNLESKFSVHTKWLYIHVQRNI